jgi:hypothetical protein
VTDALQSVRVLCPDPVALTVAMHEMALRIADAMTIVYTMR